jgi:hypothetical protein
MFAFGMKIDEQGSENSYVVFSSNKGYG